MIRQLQRMLYKSIGGACLLFCTLGSIGMLYVQYWLLVTLLSASRRVYGRNRQYHSDEDYLEDLSIVVHSLL